MVTRERCLSTSTLLHISTFSHSNSEYQLVVYIQVHHKKAGKWILTFSFSCFIMVFTSQSALLTGIACVCVCLSPFVFVSFSLSLPLIPLSGKLGEGRERYVLKFYSFPIIDLYSQRWLP